MARVHVLYSKSEEQKKRKAKKVTSSRDILGKKDYIAPIKVSQKKIKKPIVQPTQTRTDRALSSQPSHIKYTSPQKMNPPKKTADSAQTAVDKKEEKLEHDKIDEYIDNARTVLLTMKTLFPFDMFPDTVVIDVDRVNIIYKNFLNSEQVLSIPIKTLEGVYVETGPMHSTLHLVKSEIVHREVVIPHLKREDAVRARRIIGGILEANLEHIDLSKIDKKEIATKIEELGKIYGQ